ncbi:MAG: putative ATP-grasp-modified RiPP [Actinophytocola sp.]|uniref:putative ATP-grasp-modified RiPP n=1 Tax=Actinophytocola sp. TaxID=1872138 RepID=UPI003C796F5D
MTATIIELPHADSLASVSGQFALTGSSFEQRADDAPSPDGVRPWGLRRALPTSAGRVLPKWTYDVEQQKAVDVARVPLIDSPRMGDPTADTTSSTDGEDPPSSEDWNND